MHEINPVIQSRYSPLAFSSQAVEQDKLEALLEAARWAPSSYNEQPWAFVFAAQEQEADFQRLLDTLADGNKPWAQEAPLLLLSVAKTAFDRNGKPNRHAFHDVGLAAENLVLQAEYMGLKAHQMAGFDAEKARTDLKIPEKWEPVAMIAIGYRGEDTDLPEDLQERATAPRERKPLAEVGYRGVWGGKL